MSDRPRARRLHRRRWVVLGVLVLLVLAAAAAFVVLWTRPGAHPVSVDTARRRLHTTTTGRSAPTTGPGALVPAAGVYAYRGSGTDSLEKPPKTQAEGPEMPATVVHRGDGCWQFRIDYSSNHWQSWDYCAHDGTLEERGGQTYQKWDFVVFTNESTTTFACDSSVTIRAGQRPGDHWTQTCHDRDHPATVSSGPYRYLGREQLRVGDRSVAAYHYRRQRTMTGGQSGTERSEVWFAADTGLPLRNERKIDVATGTVIGDVRYTEDASFELTSLSPAG